MYRSYPGVALKHHANAVWAASGGGGRRRERATPPLGSEKIRDFAHSLTVPDRSRARYRALPSWRPQFYDGRSDRAFTSPLSCLTIWAICGTVSGPSSVSSSLITPIPPEQRDLLLDALRGAALFGVLTVNLLDGFRVSLFESILTFHTHPGWANHAVDILTAWMFEFKAFALFSLLFGIGIGIQIDRSRSHKVNQSRLFVRRFLVLLAIGLGHMLLIWNGDILAPYALCGLLLIPLAGISARRLATLGITVIVVSPYLPLFGALFPTESAMRSHAAVATPLYATGSLGRSLRCESTKQGISSSHCSSIRCHALSD